MTDTITLTGYLGKNPEIRDTAERTITLRERHQTSVFEYAGTCSPDRPQDITEEPAEYEYTLTPRDNAVLSLAPHRWEGKERITTWHRVVVWNVDRMEHIGVRIARKGSRVEITGRRTSFIAQDGRTVEQIEASHLRILQLK